MRLNGHVIIGAVLVVLGATGLSQEWIGASGPTYTTTKALRAVPFATGLVLPKDWETRKAAPLKATELYDGPLPNRWDWREHNGGLGPVRNQGSCGSCWAFSAYATLSDVIALHGKGMLDLSEQHLVSCETQSYGCNGGWYADAFALIKDEGSVLEKDFPYQARDVKCPNSLPHTYKILGYTEISTGVADTETLKRAIYAYGPVSVAVSVTGDFQNYSGGIYNNGSGGAINHATNLVGWDDTAKPPHWIMRNSWGASWGEDGYMRIAYKSKQIGYAAAYIDFAGPLNPKPAPTPKPSPSPAPGPCPECKPCTFWRWIWGMF